MLKVIAGVILFILVLISLWQIFISPDFRKLTLCFTEEASNSNSVFEEARSMPPGNERDRFICNSDVEGYTRLVSCLNSTRQKSLSFSIYRMLPKFNKTLNETVTNHNKS